MKQCKYFTYHNDVGTWFYGHCSLVTDDNEEHDVFIHNAICKFKDNPEKCPYFCAIEEK